MLYGMTSDPNGLALLLRRYEDWCRSREALSAAENAAQRPDWSASDDMAVELAHDLASAIRATGVEASDCACAVLAPDGRCRQCGAEWKTVHEDGGLSLPDDWDQPGDHHTDRFCPRNGDDPLGMPCTCEVTE